MDLSKLSIKNLLYIGIALVVGNSLLRGRSGTTSTDVRSVSTSSFISDLKYLIAGVSIGVIFNKQINKGISNMVANATKFAGQDDVRQANIARHDARYPGLNQLSTASFGRQQSILASNRRGG